MHVITHRGCADTVRESALKVDSGRKIPCPRGDSNLHQFCAWLFSCKVNQLSYSPPLGFAPHPSVPPPSFFSGLAKDHQTLRELKVTKGAKIMVVGSTLNDVLSVTAPTEQEMKEAAKTTSTKEPLSQQKVSHGQVLDLSFFTRRIKLNLKEGWRLAFENRIQTHKHIQHATATTG